MYKLLPYKMMKKFVFSIVFFLGIFSFSQSLVSRIDKKNMALGEPNILHLKVDNLQGKPVISAPKNQLLPFHFEVIKDSIVSTNTIYERTIEFAIFQEGKFTIPALEFKINNEIQKTVPYEIEVINTANKDDKINDIMSNKEVSMGLRDYWQLYKFWLLLFIVVVALIVLIYGLIKYAKKPKNTPEIRSNKALKELKILKNKNYIEQGNHRDFYVELIDIMRNFLTQQYHIPAVVLLTDDLIAYMKENHSISEQNESIIEEVFLRGDLVKFAKIFPTESLMNSDWEACTSLVKESIKDIEFENLRKDV